MDKLTNRALMELPNLNAQEVLYIQEVTRDMTDSELRNFVSMYRGKRRDPKIMMLLTLVGFLGVAGVQRFVKNDILWGILYFATGGFCLIGTVIDLINNEKHTLEYNKRQAFEASNTALAISTDY